MRGVTKPGTLSWESRGYSGFDVPADPQALDAVHLMARHMAAAHYERTVGLSRPNVIGGGYGVAHHLHATNPQEWERFKGDAVNMLTALHGSGRLSHGLTEGTSGHPLEPRGSEAYFKALHDLGADLRKS